MVNQYYITVWGDCKIFLNRGDCKIKYLLGPFRKGGLFKVCRGFMVSFSLLLRLFRILNLFRDVYKVELTVSSKTEHCATHFGIAQYTGNCATYGDIGKH